MAIFTHDNALALFHIYHTMVDKSGSTIVSSIYFFFCCFGMLSLTVQSPPHPYPPNEQYWTQLERLREDYYVKLLTLKNSNLNSKDTELKQAELLCALLLSTPQNHQMPCNLIFLEAVRKKLQTWLD